MKRPIIWGYHIFHGMSGRMRSFKFVHYDTDRGYAERVELSIEMPDGIDLYAWEILYLVPNNNDLRLIDDVFNIVRDELRKTFYTSRVNEISEMIAISPTFQWIKG